MNSVPLHAWSKRTRLLTGGAPRPHPNPARNADRFRPPATWAHRVRQVAGWIVLFVGIVGIVMPFNPAIIVIPAGVALIGRDQWLIRWSRSTGKLLLRSSVSLPSWLGRLGNQVRRAEKRVSKRLRDRRIGPWSPDVGARRARTGASPAPAGTGDNHVM